jgi:hypothetical protein
MVADERPAGRIIRNCCHPGGNKCRYGVLGARHVEQTRN